MALKSLFVAADGHKRSSSILTLVSILTFLLTLLEALPQTKWVTLAIGVIAALLVFFNRSKE